MHCIFHFIVTRTAGNILLKGREGQFKEFELQACKRDFLTCIAEGFKVRDGLPHVGSKQLWKRPGEKRLFFFVHQTLNNIKKKTNYLWCSY